MSHNIRVYLGHFSLNIGRIYYLWRMNYGKVWLMYYKVLRTGICSSRGNRIGPAVTYVDEQAEVRYSVHQCLQLHHLMSIRA